MPEAREPGEDRSELGVVDGEGCPEQRNVDVADGCQRGRVPGAGHQSRGGGDVDERSPAAGCGSLALVAHRRGTADRPTGGRARRGGPWPAIRQSHSPTPFVVPAPGTLTPRNRRRTSRVVARNGSVELDLAYICLLIILMRLAPRRLRNCAAGSVRRGRRRGHGGGRWRSGAGRAGRRSRPRRAGRRGARRGGL